MAMVRPLTDNTDLQKGIDEIISTIME
ncbi:hypothetical protein [Methanomethylovorans sp.]